MNREEFPPESCKGLWYIKKINRFKDEQGNVIHDLSALFPTWMLDKWKRKKEYALVRDRQGELWELFYDRITPDYICCGHNCFVCPTKCEVYDFILPEYREL